VLLYVLFFLLDFLLVPEYGLLLPRPVGVTSRSLEVLLWNALLWNPLLWNPLLWRLLKLLLRGLLLLLRWWRLLELLLWDALLLKLLLIWHLLELLLRSTLLLELLLRHLSLPLVVLWIHPRRVTIFRAHSVQNQHQ